MVSHYTNLVIFLGKEGDFLTTVSKTLHTIFSTIFIAFGYMFGEIKGLFSVLLVFMALDYITGIFLAIKRREVSSEIGFSGLSKKFTILFIVGVGHLLDSFVIGGGSISRSSVIGFYIANEGISILENAGNIGVPLPKFLKTILIQIKNKNDSEENL